MNTGIHFYDRKVGIPARRLSAVVAVLAASLSAATSADSLFPISTQPATAATAPSASAVSLFADTKAHRIGDLLTILIQESANSSTNADTELSKSESMNYGPGVGPILNLIQSFGLSGGMSSSSKGSNTRSDALTTEIAVTVKQILPTGNLVVEGKRDIGMNNEMEQITLTGVIRPQDIAYNNTISSTLVSDAQISYSGKGPVGSKQHDGLLTRVFSFLF
jgi:flagellar L-ring protein precursor FlgH